jgi:predicted acetyltransferase
VPISVRDARLSESDRLWIEGIYREYLDDLAPLNTGIFPVLGEVGHREPDQVAHWFADPQAHPLVIAQAAERVGFALVVRASTGSPGAAPSWQPAGGSAAGASAASYRMAEFFVSRPNRGRGVGQGAARLIFDRFAGRWQIIEYLRNPGAVRFWRRVVSRYTQGRFEERVLNGEVRQVFESARRAGT